MRKKTLLKYILENKRRLLRSKLKTQHTKNLLKAILRRKSLIIDKTCLLSRLYRFTCTNGKNFA